MSLVLSLFPGIGLLDMAFEEEGFCVVRGPDLLWGGDVRRFHPPAGMFDGVIGGPPCKRWSSLAGICRARYGEEALAPDLIPEFARCVAEAQPEWFVMENVPRAPEPAVHGYVVRPQRVRDVWVGGETGRDRIFSFGTRHGAALPIEWLALHRPDPEPTVTTSSGGRRATPKRVEGYEHNHAMGLYMAPIPEMCRRQGLPTDFLSEAPFTVAGKREAIGNGVPLPMGRAVARAVRAALAQEAA